MRLLTAQVTRRVPGPLIVGADVDTSAVQGMLPGKLVLREAVHTPSSFLALRFTSGWHAAF